MRPIDITDNRRTAESVLAVDREDIPKVVSNLTTSKRLSATIRT